MNVEEGGVEGRRASFQSSLDATIVGRIRWSILEINVRDFDHLCITPSSQIRLARSIIKGTSSGRLSLSIVHIGESSSYSRRMADDPTSRGFRTGRGNA